jgi:hypothetical protein
MSADLRCAGTPVSWLRLEQHHAGALAKSESAAITAHLATCGACAACLARIEADALEVLPTLPLAPPAPPANLFVFRRMAPLIGGLALAAALLLFLGRRTGTDPKTRGELDPESQRTKGGSVGFVLVRDDEALIAEAGGV